jgi:hypothetical protein
MSRYVWCEDSGSGFQFWRAVFSVIDDDIIVQSKGNNTRLRQAAEAIEADGNQYFIIMDSAIDNADVLRELKQLRRGIAGKKNVKVINILSFEYVLLSFKSLEDWIFAENDSLKARKADILDVRRSFIEIQEKGGDAGSLDKLKEHMHYSESTNTEQFSAKLLLAVTRHTGFETGKGYLGTCFVSDCCSLKKRRQYDVCGLDDKRMASCEKVQDIIEFSVLKQAFRKVGLI